MCLLATEIRFNKIQDLDLITSDTIWTMVKDSQGYLWFANNSGLYRYDGYTINVINGTSATSNLSNVRKIMSDSSGKLWVGTNDSGLYQKVNQNINPFISANNIEAPKHITEIIEASDGIWVGASSYLVFISKDDDLQKFVLPKSQFSEKVVTVRAIIEISDQELLVATQYNVYIFNKNKQTFTQQKMEGLTKNWINTVYKDFDKNIWIGTDIGVYVKKINTKDFSPFKKQLIDYRINTIAVDKNNIWLGSLQQGLVRVSKKDSSINKYKNNSLDNNSISGDSIESMLLDEAGVLFAASFNGGLSFFNTHSIEFGLENRTLNSISCADSEIFHGIDIEKDSLWLSTDLGVIEFSTNNNDCVTHNLNMNNKKVFDHSTPIFSFKDSLENRWITSSNGFYKIDPTTGLIDSSFQSHLNTLIYHMIEVSPHNFLLASNYGLYRFKNSKLNKVHSNQSNIKEAKTFKIIRGQSNKIIVATNKGLAVLDNKGNYKPYSEIQSQLPTESIYSIFYDGTYLWVGTSKFGLYKFNRNNKLITQFGASNGMPPNLTINSIQKVDNFLWLGTGSGLFRLNTETNQAHNFHKTDGLQGEYFIIGSAAKSLTGKLYFGGRNGLNAFYPEDIKLNTTPPSIVLTNLTRFGKKVQAGEEKDGFLINKPINNLDELVLSHKDYVIGFEFAALDFADPSRNKYAFKMEGQDPDWNYVNADDRKISYSNLASGDYTFRVKAANKDGIWNETGKSLKVKVLPAPWLTWWAYTLYVLTFFALLSAYLYRKNRANAEITKRLRIEVDKQTKELQVQKTKVESLLERKNELFANVSHEFRTPLTLILGPINKLLGSSTQSKDDVQSLQMVNRNANRLLTMIEQLLQLAKMSGHEDVNFIPQQVHSNLETLVASFQPLAETKSITLDLMQNDDAAISATQDVIDVVFGNLISNAIKYTQIGGEITVKSVKKGDFVTIEVTDNGCGLDEKQQIDIFKRFTRLDTHLDVAGVGIGLSVVEEMLKVNNGRIKVASQVGTGSTFTVRFHCIEFTADVHSIESNKTLIDQLIKESYSEEEQVSHIQYFGSKDYESILIIDDNLDMRTHLADTLKHQYYCITADRGKSGIAEAIKIVPDIIICDVMMPEMDGFQVSRILRSDTRTSHIPLILLTALNDKKNRIKGWRENIDVYLTKPFDAQELLIQLENILVIRNILKKKAGASIKSGKMSINSGLPKNDQIFVDKFMAMIAKLYMDPNFLRPQMASLMAVSERQLQRKLKALIDKNPLDLLREYRIKQAAIQLKEGQQVSITADNCGFNSVTYFSKCFKSQYGVSPKVYQQTCNKKAE